MRNQKVDEQIMHHLHSRGGGGPVIRVWRTVFTTAYFGFHQCLPGEGEEFNTGLTLMILWIVTFYCRKSQIILSYGTSFQDFYNLWIHVKNPLSTAPGHSRI